MKACDIDDGRDDVQEVEIALRRHEVTSPEAARIEPVLTTLDACAQCRAHIDRDGLAGLVAVFVEAHKPKRRRASKPTTAPGVTTA